MARRSHSLVKRMRRYVFEVLLILVSKVVQASNLVCKVVQASKLAVGSN